MTILLILLGILFASSPFVFKHRILLCVFRVRVKTTWVLLFDLLFAYCIWLLCARALEQSFGQVTPQGWQFYVVTFLLFNVAAYPIFVWRYLWR